MAGLKSDITDYLNNISLDHLSTYEDNKIQSEYIDSYFLKINYAESEAAIVGKPQKQLWIDFDVQGIQTTYKEILQIFSLLPPSKYSKWCDLGAGYGRLGIVLGLLHGECEFIGLELAEARVKLGNQLFKDLELYNCNLQIVDIAAEEQMLPRADVYFIYDFGTQEDVYKVINKLQNLALSKNIIVVARGRAVRRWILADYPWLSEVHQPEHYENWSIFYS